MQAKHGRAGKHKRYQRAAVLALTVLLIILLAGRVLPVCADKNVPAGASLKQAKPGQTLCFPLETAAWRVSDPYGWRKDPFTGEKPSTGAWTLPARRAHRSLRHWTAW